VSVNRPFKDILKQTIDEAVDLAEKQTSPDSLSTKGRQRKNWQSAASKMRVMMTQGVGEAWEQFNREKREVVVRSFRCLGISLPIDGSCDNEISIKGLDTTVLAEGLKNWELTPNSVDSSAESTSDNPETDSSDEDEPLSLFNTDPSPLTMCDSLSASSAHVPSLLTSSACPLSAGDSVTASCSSDDDMPPKAAKGNLRGRTGGRGRGSQRAKGKKSSNNPVVPICYV
jgi:hypothetical protein